MRLLQKEFEGKISTDDVCRVNYKKPLSEAVSEKYTEKYYEGGVLQKYSDLKDSDKVIVVKYEDLQKTNLIGCPFASDYDEKGKLQFYFFKNEQNSHEICIGTTGAGKTTGLVEPKIRALSTKKNKSNLFVTDPKGELFKRNAKHLEKQGFKVFVLNFRDVKHSHTWNPLAEIYDTWIKQKDLLKSLYSVSSDSDLSEYDTSNINIKDTDTIWIYQNKAYRSEEEARKNYDMDVANIHSDTASLINQFAFAVIPDKMLGSHDPSWFHGSRQICTGLINSMLEDALDERSGFTKANMNLMTVQAYYDALRNEVVSPMGNKPMLNTKIFSHKNENSISYRQLRSYYNNAANTTLSYLSCFNNALSEWFTSSIFTITNGNTINIDDCDKQPFAIFLITRDCEKSDYTIAGLMIDSIYRKISDKADKERDIRETTFILDEAANIPAIPDFQNKISTSRSRNIWFHLYLQSYSQLTNIYGSVAETIFDNCNENVYLSSQNYNSKERFARECGKQTVKSLTSVLNPAISKTIEIPLVNVNDLERLSVGEMFVRKTGMPLLRTKFVRSYECKEFRETPETSPEEMNIETLPYNDETYRYKYLESGLSMKEFSEEPKEPEKVVNIMPDFLKELL